jgi:hypothetical protein
VNEAIAFLDESAPRQDREPGTYLIAAAILAGEDQPAAREQMVRVKPKGLAKAHWHQQPDQRQRRTLVAAVAALPGTQLVVVRVGAPDIRPERRRRICLERMAYELGELGVHEAVIESRGAADDSRDVDLLQALRRQHALAAPLRFDHLAGPAEPLLWAPDILCGALNEARMGDDTYLAMLPNLRVVVVEDR